MSREFISRLVTFAFQFFVFEVPQDDEWTSTYLLCHGPKAIARADVRRALRQQSQALCQERAPRRSFRWLEPPRSPQEVKIESFPLLEESDLLSDPAAVQEQEDQLLKPSPNPAAPEQR